MPAKVEHICLVDDDHDDFYLFSSILQEVDSSVRLTYFNNSESVLEFLKENSDPPDIIVLDLNMPRISGLDCLKIIKGHQHLKHIPVLIYSTSVSDSVYQSAVSAGAQKYVVKGPTIDEIKANISAILLR